MNKEKVGPFIIWNEENVGYKPDTLDESNCIDLGLLSLDYIAIKFTMNLSHIFANGFPIGSTYNDRWTAKGVFIDFMKNIYEDKYIPPS